MVSFFLLIALAATAVSARYTIYTVPKEDKADDLAQAYSFKKYADMKGDIIFPKATAEMRTFVASQIKNMFDVYVNRESKIENYGQWTDPLPRIEKLVAGAAKMTDAEFHSTAASIFLNLRDFHTNYILPQPYSCHVAIWPIFFDIAQSNDVTRPRVVVAKLPKIPQVVSQSPEVFSNVSVGDTLVSFNDKTFQELFDENKWLSGGANDFGGQRSILSYFSARPASLFLLPNETDVKYVLRRKDGSTYSVKGNIVIRRNDACASGKEGDEMSGEDFFNPIFSPFRKVDSKRRDLAYNPFFDQVKSTFDIDYALNFNPTADDILSWSTYTLGSYKLGIIRLDSFVPSTGSVPAFLRLFRQILTEQLRDTDGLLIDVRGNGGGYVTLSDGLPQFFVQDYQPAGSRALISPINRKIFNTPEFNGTEWQTAINQDKGTYTRLIPFTSVQESNSMGQAYLKPVGVFNNGQCYSACDLFSAGMQDSEAAFVFGEDLQTGAGGANVVAHRDFFSKTLPDDFSELSFGQDMRIGWRQLVRNGKNNGKLIEDLGVFSDLVVRPSVLDFQEGATRSSQFDRIIRRLQQHGKETGKAGLSFFTDQSIEFDTPVGEPVKFTGSMSGINRLELRKGNEILKSQQFSTSKQDFEFIPMNAPFEFGFGEFTIYGYTDDKLVLKTVRDVRTIPARSDYLKVENVWKWDFNDAKFAAIYNYGSPSEHGWIRTNHSLKIGQNDQEKYHSNVQTTASLFVELPEKKRCAIYIDATIDTEENFDIFAVAVGDGQNQYPLLVRTGQDNVKNAFPLQQFSGKAIEIQFFFISDPAVEESGVEINDVILACK